MQDGPLDALRRQTGRGAASMVYSFSVVLAGKFTHLSHYAGAAQNSCMNIQSVYRYMCIYTSAEAKMMMATPANTSCSTPLWCPSRGRQPEGDVVVGPVLHHLIASFHRPNAVPPGGAPGGLQSTAGHLYTLRPYPGQVVEASGHLGEGLDVAPLARP